MQITPLSHVPHHLPVIAAWIYDAFWQDSGQSVDYIEGLLAEHLMGKPIPITLIAMQKGIPVGSVCLIENDMAERPTLTPWLAALYVLPTYRKQGIGSMLVKLVVSAAYEAGFKEVHLSADDQVALYAQHGFKIIETGVGAHHLTIMRKRLTRGK